MIYSIQFHYYISRFEALGTLAYAKMQGSVPHIYMAETTLIPVWVTLKIHVFQRCSIIWSVTTDTIPRGLLANFQ